MQEARAHTFKPHLREEEEQSHSCEDRLNFQWHVVRTTVGEKKKKQLAEKEGLVVVMKSIGTQTVLVRALCLGAAAPQDVHPAREWHSGVHQVHPSLWSCWYHVS